MKRLTIQFILAILFLSPIVAHDDHEPPDGAMDRALLPNVVMPEQRHASTLVSSLYALLPALGHTNWSIDRLTAFTGYAFYFQVKEGAGPMFDDNLDWNEAMKVFEPFGRAETFDTTKKMTDVDVPAEKAKARDAVVASLQNGVPALAWAPLAKEQVGKVRFACWGLIVGYDPSDETYIIRQPSEKSDYPLRYDAIGFADDSEWFHVEIFEPKDIDDHAFHVDTLRKALFFANSAHIGHHTDRPNGFAAYEHWIDALEAAPLSATHTNVEHLTPRRRSAAAYLRDLVSLYPNAAEQLGAAAAGYDREVEYLDSFHDICHAVQSTDEKAFTKDQREEARRLLIEALENEREAIEQIERALEIIDAS